MLRVFLIATATGVVLYFVLKAIGVTNAVLIRNAVILALAGVIVALVVERFLKRPAAAPPEKQP